MQPLHEIIARVVCSILAFFIGWIGHGAYVRREVKRQYAEHNRKYANLQDTGDDK